MTRSRGYLWSCSRPTRRSPSHAGASCSSRRRPPRQPQPVQPASPCCTMESSSHPTSLRVVLRVTKILVPGARPSEHARDVNLLEGGRALFDFTELPSSMVERHTNLQNDSPFAAEHSGSAADEMDADQAARAALTASSLPAEIAQTLRPAIMNFEMWTTSRTLSATRRARGLVLLHSMPRRSTSRPQSAAACSRMPLTLQSSTLASG